MSPESQKEGALTPVLKSSALNDRKGNARLKGRCSYSLVEQSAVDGLTLDNKRRAAVPLETISASRVALANQPSAVLFGSQ